jgi:tryptophan synthase alpha chain
MTTAISSCFKNLSHQGECAFIPFITAGDPDLETTAKALLALDANGADIIELGVPYSDPLADGPVIQAAATRALEKGTKLEAVLSMVKVVVPQLKAPIILFTYYNPILNRGVDNFLRLIADAGVAGLIVPDLPLEESASLLERSAAMGIDVILLIAPTSSKERIETIARASQGFIYLVSVTGVTGMRSQMEVGVSDLIKQIRNVTDKPVGVGFGISEVSQALQLREWGADAVIVGSAIVKRLAEGTPEQGISSIIGFSQNLKAAIKEKI